MLDSLIEDYIDSCLEIVNDVEKNKLDLKPFYLCLNLFVKMFIKRNNYELDTNDIMANSYYELDTNSTSEAKYINNWYTKK